MFTRLISGWIACVVVVCPATFTVAGDEPPEIPKPLRELVERREAIKSADIQWSVMRTAGAKANVEFFHRTRHASNGDRIEQDLGDWQGRQSASYRGERHWITDQLRRTLFKGTGGAYDYSTGKSTIGELTAIEARSTFPAPIRGDIRMLGVGLRYRFLMRADEALWAGVNREATGEPTRFTQRESGGVLLVEAEFETGQKVVWELEPQKGGNPRRIYFLHSDNTIPMETTISLHDWDGVWFPEEVEYRSNGEIASVVRVQAAAFGDKLPAEFTLLDIGAEPGMTVARTNHATSFEPVWDGDKTIPRAEWDELVRRGERKEGPTVIKERETLAKEGQDPPVEVLRKAYTLTGVIDAPLTAWRMYKERVIAAYQMDEEQKQKCELVLQEAEQMARQKAEAAKADLDELEKRLVEAKKKVKGPDADAVWDKLDADVRSAIAFVQTIFDERLAPGLHSVATRAQRKAAVERGSVPVPFP